MEEHEESGCQSAIVHILLVGIIGYLFGTFLISRFTDADSTQTTGGMVFAVLFVIADFALRLRKDDTSSKAFAKDLEAMLGGDRGSYNDLAENLISAQKDPAIMKNLRSIIEQITIGKPALVKQILLNLLLFRLPSKDQMSEIRNNIELKHLLREVLIEFLEFLKKLRS